jgi:hypothetical protein
MIVDLLDTSLLWQKKIKFIYLPLICLGMN